MLLAAPWTSLQQLRQNAMTITLKSAFYANKRKTMNHFLLHSLFIVLIFTSSLLCSTNSQLDEAERLKEYYKRYQGKWPPEVRPNTEGWQKQMWRRLAQVERVEDRADRYNAYVSAMTMSVVAQNYTENGWGVTRAPDDLMKQLRAKLHEGLSGNPREEYYVNVIEGKLRPWFIPNTKLNSKVLRSLKPMHEEWSGIPLEGATSYGLRVYRNGSELYMHVDQPETHVISSILHIDHSEDSEPWPLYIEDFHGNTHEVVLESGDMLFYESSKCIHGRPRQFKGSWYSSIFTHYFPAEWKKADADDRLLESHYAVPKHWVEVQPKDDRLDKLIMSGTSYIEPDCPNNWCNTQNTIKWNGPFKDGVVISTGYTEGDDEDKTKNHNDGEEL